jgi:hypothetical protein
LTHFFEVFVLSREKSLSVIKQGSAIRAQPPHQLDDKVPCIPYPETSLWRIHNTSKSRYSL